MEKQKDDKVIKNAQYRKGLGIAWFNATNSAIEMVKLESTMKDLTRKVTVQKKGTKTKIVSAKVPSVEDRLAYWRNKFLEDHKNYYAEVIAPIGAPYDSKTTLDLLNAVKTKEELKKLWMSISEDERHDGDIRKVVKELKAKLK